MKADDRNYRFIESLLDIGIDLLGEVIGLLFDVLL
jgi:hypothetical protein